MLATLFSQLVLVHLAWRRIDDCIFGRMLVEWLLESNLGARPCLAGQVTQHHLQAVTGVGSMQQHVATASSPLFIIERYDNTSCLLLMLLEL